MIIGEAPPPTHMRSAFIEKRFQRHDAGAENAQVRLNDAVQRTADFIVRGVFGLRGLHNGEKAEDGNDTCPVHVSASTKSCSENEKRKRGKKKRGGKEVHTFHQRIEQPEKIIAGSTEVGGVGG